MEFDKNKINLKIAISKIKEENDIVMKNKNRNILRVFITAIASVILCSGVVFAVNFNKIINYFGLGEGINTATNNGYIEMPDENYIQSNTTLEDENNVIILDDLKTNVKISEFLMTDLNLSVNFDFEFDKEINETVSLKDIKDIDLQDLIITDEENRIVYSKTTKERFDEFCKSHNLPYTFGEFNENYMNNGVNKFVNERDLTTNKMILTYNMYAEGFPKSKKLKFDFTKILIKEMINDKIGKNIILTGEWNINVDVPEKMYNREIISYKVKSCSNKDFKITTAFATNTGFEIGIIIDNMEKPTEPHWMIWVDQEIKKELNEGKITESEVDNRKNELQKSTKYQEVISQWKPINDVSTNGETIENISFVENEKGKKFIKSLNAGRKQEYNFIDGNKFNYYETYELTRYDVTNRLKMQIMFKGEPVIIELEKL